MYVFQTATRVVERTTEARFPGLGQVFPVPSGVTTATGSKTTHYTSLCVWVDARGSALPIWKKPMHFTCKWMKCPKNT